MTKIITLLGFLLISCGFAQAQIQTEQIQALIDREVANKRAKSIIVGIVDSSGRHIISAGRLSDTDGRKPDGNTMYEIGSITKVFAGLLLADLSLENQVQLDDPVSKFVPSYVRVPAMNGKQITLRHLVSHRAGFPRNPVNVDPGNLDNPFADYTPELLYEYISNFTPTREANARFQYSNSGFCLLGEVVTKVSGKDFETLTKERINAALGMDRTVYKLTPQLRENLAPPHLPNGARSSEWDIQLVAGGGLRSCANDLLTFAAANAGLVQTRLQPAIELSHLPQAKKEGKEFMAMGWTLYNQNGENIVYKDGSTGGYYSFIGVDKVRKRGIIILSNTSNSVTDLGKHLLDSRSPVETYTYTWAVYDTVYSTVKKRGAKKAISLYQELKAQQHPRFSFDEQQLLYVGNELRRQNKIKEAIQIYQYNLQEYPKSVNTYDQLAETYKRQGNKKMAIETFEKLAAMDDNLRWKWMLAKLKAE
ncbi:serine hydrolase [Pedobacter sp. SYSU D00535]|uniref:serine hydrolase n=1 Tax=Pedobacter sp. SYSU D00535 TaxID=2810308 RepID=UPI001A978D7D|nr:serine hydrolase [Pedobacter sp. SYSU D00535]